MGASGQTTINFGAFPGVSDVSLAITGQAGIVAGSLVEAWLALVATADHSADEHFADGPLVYAGNIIAGTGFTIYARARDKTPVPDGTIQKLDPGQGEDVGRTSPMVYGLWTVNWVWV